MNKFLTLIKIIISLLCFFYLGYIEGIKNKDNIEVSFFNNQDTGLMMDNKIIFTIFGQEIWEGPTPEFSVKDQKLFSFYALPNDLYIMYLSLEYLYTYNFCKEESPCCIYIEKDNKPLGEFPIYP